jgi:hypothetical protein
MPGRGTAAGISRGVGGSSAFATAPDGTADMDVMLAKVDAESAHLADGCGVLTSASRR